MRVNFVSQILRVRMLERLYILLKNTLRWATCLRPCVSIDELGHICFSVDFIASEEMPPKDLLFPPKSKKGAQNRISHKRLRIGNNVGQNEQCVLLFLGLGIRDNEEAIDINGDAELLRKELLKTGVIKIVKRNSVHRKDIVSLIDKYRPKIIHFDGHGRDGMLAMEDSSVNSGDLFFHEFKDVLELEKGSLDLVYFDSCESLSMANEVSEFLPCAIGFENTVRACDARRFSLQFYSSLARRKSISKAYEAACAHMKILGGGSVPHLRVGNNYESDLSFFKG